MSDDKARKIRAEYAPIHNTDEAVANSASDDAYRQIIRRERRKNEPDFPKQPETLEEIDFSDNQAEFLTQTLEEDSGWLMYLKR